MSHGEGEEGGSEPRVEDPNEPPTDDELRATLLRILASDPDCPISEHVRRCGTSDHAVLWTVTAYLLLAVNTGTRTSAAPARAFRIVWEEFEMRTAIWELN